MKLCFTASTNEYIIQFVDRIQGIDYNIPVRIIDSRTFSRPVIDESNIGIEVNYYDLKLISSDGMEIRNLSKYSKLSIHENNELAIKSSNEYIENKLIIDCNIISLNNDNDNSNVNT
ncbi:669_t:CDS:2, partial [Entrophospora sp. SA101]